MAIHTRWDDVKRQRLDPSEEERSTIERELALALVSEDNHVSDSSGRRKPDE